MASVSVLEEGLIDLESNELERIQLFYENTLDSLFKGSNFLKEGEHLKLLKNKKGLSRCYEAAWCLPKVAEDLIPLRLVTLFFY